MKPRMKRTRPQWSNVGLILIVLVYSSAVRTESVEAMDSDRDSRRLQLKSDVDFNFVPSTPGQLNEIIYPTTAPTDSPAPSPAPSSTPTRRPSLSLAPTESITESPTDTLRPTPTPSSSPTMSPEPTKRPTQFPTVMVITASPTSFPTAEPTTEAPSKEPTPSPTPPPTPPPTPTPTPPPTPTPSWNPTRTPTLSQTQTPSSKMPTLLPTPFPIESPSTQPSHQETGHPTDMPTGAPVDVTAPSSPVQPETDQPSPRNLQTAFPSSPMIPEEDIPITPFAVRLAFADSLSQSEVDASAIELRSVLADYLLRELADQDLPGGIAFTGFNLTVTPSGNSTRSVAARQRRARILQDESMFQIYSYNVGGSADVSTPGGDGMESSVLARSVDSSINNAFGGPEKQAELSNYVRDHPDSNVLSNSVETGVETQALPPEPRWRQERTNSRGHCLRIHSSDSRRVEFVILCRHFLERTQKAGCSTTTRTTRSLCR